MRVFVSVRAHVFAWQDSRASVRACELCVCELIENAMLNAGRTKIYFYQLLTSCHSRGVSESALHILLLPIAVICKSFLKLSILL